MFPCLRYPAFDTVWHTLMTPSCPEERLLIDERAHQQIMESIRSRQPRQQAVGVKSKGRDEEEQHRSTTPDDEEIEDDEYTDDETGR